jgi:Cu(I)/Ag(I) efflux system membrane fusion protein
MSEHPTPEQALPEGEEAAPPGVRSAAAVRWTLVVLMAFAAVGAWAYWADLAPRHARATAQYQCPMHPSVIQDRPGDCPICGMDLVHVQAGAAKGAAGPAATTATAPAAKGRYFCPMHPEVASDDPNARCPKCGGMKLVPRPAATAAPGSPGGPVPGLADVDIGSERRQLIGLRTAPVKRGALAEQLRTIGFVSANESKVATVTTRFTGWVESLAVSQSGQRVEKGQVLATLYSPELLTAQQVYLNAARWADKSEGAAANNAQSLDADARKRLLLLGVAQEDITALAKKGQVMNAVPLRSPVAGYVAKKAALTGAYVQAGAELFQIADLSTVWIVADVYERDMARVRVGERATLTLAAYPGETFTGSVQFVYPAVNPETRTLQARMEFRNPGMKLRPGMYGDVVLETGAAEGLTVPSEAVVDTGERQYVFLARDAGRFEPRTVRVGARAGDEVQVLEGVAEGDLVVTTANFLVDSESRLRAAVEGFAAAHPRRLQEKDEKDEHEGSGEHEHRARGDRAETARADADHR